MTNSSDDATPNADTGRDASQSKGTQQGDMQTARSGPAPVPPAQATDTTPASDGFAPGDRVEGWTPGNEGQMLQQKVRPGDPGASQAFTRGTSGASTNQGAASQQHDERPGDPDH